MTAPDNSRTFITLSGTAKGARAALNCEAVLKRWMREQEVQIVSNDKIEAAIDRQELGISIIGQEPEAEPFDEVTDVTPAGPVTEAEPMAQEHPNERALANQARLRAPSVACPDCGKMFRPGGLNSHRAKMHFKYSPNQKPNGSEPKVAPVEADSKPVFTIDEVVAIANYGSGGAGLIEVSRLRDGLIMASRLRGDA